MEASRDKSICLPFESEEYYERCMRDNALFRATVTSLHAQYPELFPSQFDQGFRLYGRRFSTKQQLWTRRLELKATSQVFGVRPSFVMPYMTARTDEVEKVLYLRHWGVPYTALAHVFGRNPMFWYRVEMALGRPSLVGTTVKAAARLPQHLGADEKHTKALKDKLFVPTVVGKGCILGAAVTTSANPDDLEAGYGEFAQEARELDCTYTPETVCTDGWDATQTAWRRLFPGICVILCFLHSVLKVAQRYFWDRSLRKTVVDKAWTVYQAVTARQFSQRVRRFREWIHKRLVEGGLKKVALKLCAKKDQFLRAYAHPGAHRTSNAVDRLHDHLDRRLYAMKYFHGHDESARLAVRAMALTYNFHPYGSRLRSDSPQRRSPFHDLNGFEYHHNWLHNLLIAASMGGRKL